MQVRSIVTLAALLLVAGISGCGGSKGSNGTGPPPPAAELSGNLTASGGQYAHRFAAAGAYPYHCTIHIGMTGIVIVSASAPAVDSLQTVSVTGSTFSPSSVTIPVNGVVTWTNIDAMLHTVTSD